MEYATPQFDNHSLAQLRDMLATLKDEIDERKAYATVISAEVNKRLSPVLSAALAESGKDHGSLTREIDGLKIKGEVKQTTKWDSDQLRTIAATMTWEQIEHYFKIEFSVPAAIYKALEPGKLKDALTKARTISNGDMSVSFVATKD